MYIHGIGELIRLNEVVMSKENNQQIWIAVRIERGFPVEAKGYKDRKLAEKQEKLWRKEINLDYDETGVLKIKIE